jgi:hypothetical protein
VPRRLSAPWIGHVCILLFSQEEVKKLMVLDLKALQLAATSPPLSIATFSTPNWFRLQTLTTAIQSRASAAAIDKRDPGPSIRTIFFSLSTK